jgi:hypothetical protein
MCLRDDALHVTNPNTQRARNFANTCPVSPHSPYLCGARRIVVAAATKCLSVCFGAFEPRTDTLPDDRPLKFREYAEHLKQRLTGRCGGIETLLMQIEIKPLCMEFRYGQRTSARRLGRFGGGARDLRVA